MTRAIVGTIGCVLATGGAFLAGAQEAGGPHLELPQIVERGSSGPLLLLIPCAGCGAPSWERFMEENEDRFRMVAVTLPGYDGSPRPELPLWTDRVVFQDNALARLADLLVERDLRDVVVVGHSFGATMAVRLADRIPQRVRAVVGIDSAPTTPPEDVDRTQAERMEAVKRAVDDDWAVRLQDPTEFRNFNAARGLPDPESRLLHHGMFMASDRVTMIHYWRENGLQDLNPGFRGLAAPYLDIDAIRAGVERPDSVAAAYVSAMDQVGRPVRYTLVRYWSTTHWVHVEHPRALGGTILDFLDGRVPADVGAR